MVAENHLNRKFSVSKPSLVWLTDITYIRTQEGWLFLAVVLDLYSRSVIGWSMSEQINTDLALGALTMACWRRKDHAGVAFILIKGANIPATSGAACSKRMSLGLA